LNEAIPNDSEAERALIGACLSQPVQCIPIAQREFTSEEAFHDERHKIIWRTIGEMCPTEIDVVTVQSKIGMLEYLNQCVDACFSTANLQTWIQIVREKHILRKVLHLAHNAIKMVNHAEGTTALLDALEADVMKLRIVRSEIKTIKVLVADATHVMEFKAMNGDKITGLSTGLMDLDTLTDGLHGGEMIVVAALPSCGKTALGVNVAVFNALAGNPVGILSAEMRPVQLVVRSLCAESRVNMRRITEGDIVPLQTASVRIANAPIYIEQVSGFTIGQVIATGRRLKQAHGIKLLVLDYIQLITGIGDNREQQVSSVGRGMKMIASELEIPVIALSQLNDDGKLRESRAIGQDADSVWVLTNDGEWQPHSQPITLSVDKCRDGETGKVKLLFQKQHTRFESVSKFHDGEPRKQHND
jgi:replicative DNA helicase